MENEVDIFGEICNKHIKAIKCLKFKTLPSILKLLLK